MVALVEGVFSIAVGPRTAWYIVRAYLAWSLFGLYRVFPPR